MRKALTVFVVAALALVGPPISARAETFYRFQSPSENIYRGMGSLGNRAFASWQTGNCSSNMRDTDGSGLVWVDVDIVRRGCGVDLEGQR
jgi:hypothetical protein